MLSIRLSRTGKIHDPHYRIVVQEKRSKLNGSAIDNIGHYHPAHPSKILVINAEKAKMWLARGAQPSDTVINLFVKEGILDKSKKVHNFFTPTKKEEPAVEKAAVEAKAEEAEQTSEDEAVEEVAPTKAELEETPDTETPAEA